MLDTGSSDGVRAVAFRLDEIHLLGGGNDGIRRWRLEDGQEVGKQTGMRLNAISVSRNHKWVVCGTAEGASVWDMEIQTKLVDVEGRDTVMAVDISADSTTFATATLSGASVWHITSGERLVGPVGDGPYVAAVRFSPSGERVAASSYDGSILVFDSRNGDKLSIINTVTSRFWPQTPLAWSSNGRQIFVASNDSTIKLFDVSTGSQLAESPTLKVNSYDYVNSIALAANGKFIATFANRTISFLETSTLTRIVPVIEDSTKIFSIALSADSGYVATGLSDGKVTIRNLGGILPDSYGPFHVSICPFTMLACQASLVPSPALTHYVRHLIPSKDN